jgi:hypothetical protein
MYRDIDADAAALERAVQLNAGRRRTPTIDLDGEILVEPSNETLTSALVRHGRVTEDEARERQQIQNVGDLERGVRVAVGALALLGATRAAGPSRAPLALAGAMGVLTGISGWCPLYNAAEVSSLGGPGDRPEEAERSSWLVRAARPSAV